MAGSWLSVNSLICVCHPKPILQQNVKLPTWTYIILNTLLNVGMYLRGLHFSFNQCCKTSELIPLANGV